jgi:hypothetical protein
MSVLLLAHAPHAIVLVETALGGGYERKDENVNTDTRLSGSA